MFPVAMPVSCGYNKEKGQEVTMMPDRGNDLQEEDEMLLFEANSRLEAERQQAGIPWNIVLDELGITGEELERAEDVAIE